MARVMRATEVDLATSRRAGLVLTLSAIPLCVAGLVIAFSVDHSPAVGLLGLVVLTAGSVATRLVAVLSRANLGRYWAASNLVTGILALVICILSAVFLAGDPTPGIFTLLLSVWVAVSVVCDTVLGVNSGDPQMSRDLKTVALAGVVVVLVETFVSLTSVWAVGIFGAYLILSGVYIAIAGMSLRFKEPQPQPGRGRKP